MGSSVQRSLSSSNLLPVPLLAVRAHHCSTTAVCLWVPVSQPAPSPCPLPPSSSSLCRWISPSQPSTHYCFKTSPGTYVCMCVSNVLGFHFAASNVTKQALLETVTGSSMWYCSPILRTCISITTYLLLFSLPLRITANPQKNSKICTPQRFTTIWYYVA